MEIKLNFRDQIQAYRNNSWVSPETKVRFSEIKGKLGFKGVVSLNNIFNNII